MEKTEIRQYAIPTWALCYICNGDKSCITDEEIKMIDDWLDEHKIQCVSPVENEHGEWEEYFSNYPEFGLGSNVMDCDCLVKIEG